jgi:opacity protein-like surface antigen
MKYLSPVLLSAFILLPCCAAAQATEKQTEKKQPAAYWQLNYGISQNAYTYSISLESKDLDQTEKKINALAEEAGIPSAVNQPQYMYGRGSSNKILCFNTTADKAEAFAQKVITAAKLRQYSTYNSLNEPITPK